MILGISNKLMLSTNFIIPLVRITHLNIDKISVDFIWRKAQKNVQKYLYLQGQFFDLF